MENASEENSNTLEEIDGLIEQVIQLYNTTVQEDVENLEDAVAKKQQALAQWKAEIEHSTKTIREREKDIDALKAKVVGEKENDPALEELRAVQHEKEALQEELESYRRTEKDSLDALTELEHKMQQLEITKRRETQVSSAQLHHMRLQLSLYASIAPITWDELTDRISGTISLPHTKTFRRFEVDMSLSPYDLANTLWDTIEHVH